MHVFLPEQKGSTRKSQTRSAGEHVPNTSTSGLIKLPPASRWQLSEATPP
jgi:hypothetical protein